MQQHPLRHDLLGPLPNSQVSLKTWEHFGAGMGLSNNPYSLGRVTGPMYADTHFDLSLSFPFVMKCRPSAWSSGQHPQAAINKNHSLEV